MKELKEGRGIDCAWWWGWQIDERYVGFGRRDSMFSRHPLHRKFVFQDFPHLFYIYYTKNVSISMYISQQSRWLPFVLSVWCAALCHVGYPYALPNHLCLPTPIPSIFWWVPPKSSNFSPPFVSTTFIFSCMS